MRTTEELLTIPIEHAADIARTLRTLQLTALMQEHDALMTKLNISSESYIDPVLSEMLLLPAKLVVAFAAKMGPAMPRHIHAAMDTTVTKLLDQAIEVSMPLWSFTFLEQSGLARDFVCSRSYLDARNLAVAALAACYETIARSAAAAAVMADAGCNEDHED
jgi:hypothetical protein